MKTIILIIAIILLANYAEAQKLGCTDPLAINYDNTASENDGSCIYHSVLVNTTSSVVLPEILHETSGLIYWNQKLWTHNDSEDINLYAFSPNNVNSLETFGLTGTVNVDWEEISQDEKYIYIGDFGNNGSGNRKDLKILRIDKNSVLANSPIIDTISFNYSTQTDYSPAEPNRTNFDCEAFIVTDDSIYLFTKEWIDRRTSIYSLPKSPGTYTAIFRDTYNVQGLITGAVYLKSNKLIVLSGYSELLQPFVFLLYDFKGNDFFSGNKRKIDVDLSLHQVEGITSENGLIYYLTNERFVLSPISIAPKLHVLDLSAFLIDYLRDVLLRKSNNSEFIHINPVPADRFIYIETGGNHIGMNYYIMDIQGKAIVSGKISEIKTYVDIELLPMGDYLFLLGDDRREIKKITVVR